MNQVIQIILSPEELHDMITNAVKEAVRAPLREFELKMNGGLMQPKEVAQMLGVSYQTVKSMWKRGDIEMVLVKNMPKVTRESVYNHLNKKS